MNFRTSLRTGLNLSVVTVLLAVGTVSTGVAEIVINPYPLKKEAAPAPVLQESSVPPVQTQTKPERVQEQKQFAAPPPRSATVDSVQAQPANVQAKIKQSMTSVEQRPVIQGHASAAIDITEPPQSGLSMPTGTTPPDMRREKVEPVFYPSLPANVPLDITKPAAMQVLEKNQPAPVHGISAPEVPSEEPQKQAAAHVPVTLMLPPQAPQEQPGKIRAPAPPQLDMPVEAAARGPMSAPTEIIWNAPAQTVARNDEPAMIEPAAGASAMSAPRETFSDTIKKYNLVAIDTRKPAAPVQPAIDRPVEDRAASVEQVPYEPDLSPVRPSVIQKPGLSAGKTQAWQAVRGADLRDTLKLWSRDSGVHLIWNAGDNFFVPRTLYIGTSYEDAIRVLLESYAGQDMRPIANLYVDPKSHSRTLVIDLGA